jgi:hypothetical protein
MSLRLQCLRAEWASSIPRELMAGAVATFALMLDVLGVPFPGVKIDAPFFQFLGRGALHALRLIWLDAVIATRWRWRAFPARVGLLFLLANMLTEALFRLPFMAGYCTEAFAVAFAAAATDGEPSSSSWRWSWPRSPC